jgi:NADPH-dependent F420 reductase
MSARRRRAKTTLPPLAKRSGRAVFGGLRRSFARPVDEQLRIGVVGGTGSEGRGLAVRFALTGLPITIGSRDPARAREVARELSERHLGASIAGASNEETIAKSNVVILAIPFAHAGALVEACRDLFTPGTLVIDVTVPLVFEAGKPRFVEPAEGSAAEHLRRRLPDQAALACAFKTLPARLLEHVETPLDCDDFVCGDSVESRDRVAAVVRRIPGLRPVDTGPLESARVVERMTLLAVTINKRYKRHGARFQVLGI